MMNATPGFPCSEYHCSILPSRYRSTVSRTSSGRTANTCVCSKPGLMVPMARILVVGVVFIASPCAFAELKPTRQPISANAAAETNFMLSPFCVSLRRPGEPVGRASPARQPDSNDRFGGAHSSLQRQIAVSAARELAGMLFDERAHAHWRLAGELEHVGGHAVEAALSVKLSQHGKVLDNVLRHAEFTKLFGPCRDRHVAVMNRTAERFGEGTRIMIQIDRLGASQVVDLADVLCGIVENGGHDACHIDRRDGRGFGIA